MLEAILSDAGYDVVLVNSVREALDALDEGAFVAAILDLNLKGEKVYPVAEKLIVAGTPFIFSTGGGREVDGYPDRPWIGKPFHEPELVAAVAKLVG
jgi:DNA-binding response OmpR family regulator